MPDLDDFSWFKTTFGTEASAALQGTPFSMDLLVAIAAQETGQIWSTTRKTLEPEKILEICVGDTLDEDRGRRAFPRTKAQLLTSPRGEEMFELAHEALVEMAKQVPSFSSVAKRADKFCHGFGIFQSDLQAFQADPDYFLQRQWADFSQCLKRCLEDLHEAAGRIGLGEQETLADLDQVHVAIAYNAGSFRPSKGLKQGFFDGRQFYGELIFDFLRRSQTVGTAASPAALTAPLAGRAAIAMASPVTVSGKTLRVDVRDSPLMLRSEPRIDRSNPASNVIARLPDGQLVKLISGQAGDRFLEVETSLNGAHLQGFAAAEFLVPVRGNPEVPVAAPQATPPAAGIVAVFAPQRPGAVTRRSGVADAHSLNESGQPGREGTTPQELREELATIIDYLAADKASNRRYQPRTGVTFCNIYAHDYCFLAGVYLPRVWWTPDAIERLAQGTPVTPLLGNTIDEQRANDLFRWLRAFRERFGWRQTGTLTKLQTEVNTGAVGLIVARRTMEGRSGHIVAVVPETEDNQAKRDAAGEVIAPLQSQAGATNFRYGTGRLNWWKGAEFADSAFWIQA